GPRGPRVPAVERREEQPPGARTARWGGDLALLFRAPPLRARDRPEALLLRLRPRSHGPHDPEPERAPRFDRRPRLLDGPPEGRALGGRLAPDRGARREDPRPGARA